MSLLNLASDGRRGVLVALFKLLAAEGATPRDRVLHVCAPEGVADRSSTSQTLNRWTELGLFRSEGENVSIAPEIPARERLVAKLPAFARTRALASENNQRFWEAEESRSADFTRAVTWLLVQDVFESEFARWADVEAALKRQIPATENNFIQNDTRWTGIRAWGPYLGFGHVDSTRGGAFMVDPTPAVRDALPAVFGKKKTLVAGEFLSRLAEELPVVDGGAYRDLVEQRLRTAGGPEAWQAPPADQLSTSLSRALLRLTQNGTLTAETHSDAPSRARLTGRNRAVIAEFSHVKFAPAR